MTLHSDIICNIADSIFGRERGLIAVLHHAYFDESGTHDGAPVMTIAGYLFTSEQARKFSRDWAKDLVRMGLPFAHMTDCALGFGDYERMTLEERVDSEKLLISHIKRRSIFGYAIAAPKPSYELIMQGLNAHSIYTFLLQIAVLKVRDLAAERGVQQIAYFFESGHEFANEAHNYMNLLASIPKHKEYFLYAGHAFVDKRQALPLQAADMLAWQERHYRTRKLQGHEKRRADYKALVRPVDRFSEVQPEDILRLQDRQRRGVTPIKSLPKPFVEGLLETGRFQVVTGQINRGDVLMTCPETGKGVPTGFAMSNETLNGTEVTMTFTCAACRGTHSFNKSDAWVHG